jgi:putative transposase
MRLRRNDLSRYYESFYYSSMPYSYRGLTREEQEEVVRRRRKAGVSLHAPPHPFRQAGCYLITAANFEHAPVMALSTRRTEFEALLLGALKAIDADVYAWVVLPNHYHALVGLQSLDTLSAALKQLHGSTSRAWNLADSQTGRRRVWYQFSDRLIRDQQHFLCALNDVHYNPVKHGYASDPCEWPWVSLSTYLETNGRDWLREAWTSYPSMDFGKGRDD